MHDHDLDDGLDARLAAMEARAPGRDDPPRLERRSRPPRFAVSIAMAPVLVLALVATAAAGTAIVSGLTAEAHPGVQNPGQPLEGAAMECLTPPEAQAFLAERGFTDVVWQVESGTLVAPDGGKGQSSTVQQSTAPEHGYVVPGSIGDDGRLTMVVDQRVGATGVGACVDAPMP
jgi:hypothetical protein